LTTGVAACGELDCANLITGASSHFNNYNNWKSCDTPNYRLRRLLIPAAVLMTVVYGH